MLDRRVEVACQIETAFAFCGRSETRRCRWNEENNCDKCGYEVMPRRQVYQGVGTQVYRDPDWYCRLLFQCLAYL